MDRDSRKNIFLAVTGGLLLGIPWAASSLFFLIFIAWVPLFALEQKVRHHPNPYLLFNYALAGFLLWNITGTWWVSRAHLVGAILIMVANSLIQALVFWGANRVRVTLKVPLVVPFLLFWMGYEHFLKAVKVTYAEGEKGTPGYSAYRTTAQREDDLVDAWEELSKFALHGARLALNEDGRLTRTLHLLAIAVGKVVFLTGLLRKEIDSTDF